MWGNKDDRCLIDNLTYFFGIITFKTLPTCWFNISRAYKNPIFIFVNYNNRSVITFHIVMVSVHITIYFDISIVLFVF